MVKIHFLGRKIAKRRFQPFLPARRNLNRVRSVFPRSFGGAWSCSTISSPGCWQQSLEII